MYTVEIRSKDCKMGLGHGYIVPETNINKLVGKLLTTIETLGLQEKQEKAFQDIVKQVVWSSVMGVKTVDGGLLTIVNNLMYEMDREVRHRDSNVNNVDAYNQAISSMVGDYEIKFTEKE